MTRETVTVSFTSDPDVLRESQCTDVILSQVIEWINSGSRPPKEFVENERTLRKLWWEYPKLTIVNGILYRRLLFPGRSCLQTVIPSNMVTETLELLHGNGYSGHVGFDKTLQKAQQCCYWPFMQRDIREYCATCRPCHYRSQPNPRNKAPLQSIKVSRPFELVCADITELPITPKGNRYVLVLMDHFSKYVNLYAMPDQKAITVAKCIFENYIRQHGIPEQIHTDQGRQFEAEIIQTLCKVLGINKTRTTPYHPQSDGLIERFNRTLKDQLGKLLLQNDGTWEDYLGYVEFAYNTATHSTTGFSPYFIINGRDARIPATLISSPLTEVSLAAPGTPAEYCTSLQSRLQTVFRQVLEDTMAAQDKQKYYYDANMKYKPFSVGDLVMLENAAERRVKLAPKWTGPFRITRVLSQPDRNVLTYQIQNLKNTTKVLVVHHNRLKLHLPEPNHNTPQEVLPKSSVPSPQVTTSTLSPAYIVPPIHPDPPLYSTRSGRQIKSPHRYGE